jgi:hypothetical protein
MKIFLLGDSFTDNLFKFHYNNILIAESNENFKWVLEEPIAIYLKKLKSMGAPDPLWFDDWLINWGYDVYNFGRGSCTIEDIIYQFANIKNYDFEDGDRIILNWTHPSRFNWAQENGSVHYIHTHADGVKNEELKKEFQHQTINRETSFDSGYLNKNLLPFMEYIVKMHDKYKPIIWTPFFDLDNILLNKEHYFSFQSQNGYDNFLSKLPLNWSMRHETNGLINDGHYGRYGNYYLAILFDTIIKNDLKSYYNKDNFIFETALERIKSENITFPEIILNII